MKQRRRKVEGRSNQPYGDPNLLCLMQTGYLFCLSGDAAFSPEKTTYPHFDGMCMFTSPCGDHTQLSSFAPATLM
jgi:hypothetical protein